MLTKRTHDKARKLWWEDPEVKVLSEDSGSPGREEAGKPAGLVRDRASPSAGRTHVDNEKAHCSKKKNSLLQLEGGGAEAGSGVASRGPRGQYPISQVSQTEGSRSLTAPLS